MRLRMERLGRLDLSQMINGLIRNQSQEEIMKLLELMLSLSLKKLQLFTLISALLVASISVYADAPINPLRITDHMLQDDREAINEDSEINYDFGTIDVSSAKYENGLFKNRGFYLYNLTSEDIILEHVSIPRGIEAEYSHEPKRVSLKVPARGWTYVGIYVNASNLTPGLVSKKVQFYSSKSTASSLTIDVHGWIDQCYGIWPDNIDFGNINSGEKATTQFHLVLDPKVLAYDDPKLQKRLPHFSGGQTCSVKFVSVSQGTTNDWAYIKKRSESKRAEEQKSGLPIVITYEVTFKGRGQTGPFLDWLNTLSFRGTIGDVPLRNVHLRVTGRVVPIDKRTDNNKDSCNCGDANVKSDRVVSTNSAKNASAK